MVIKFTKMEGSGNDFVVIEDGVKLTRLFIVKLCDRIFGIGADGVLVLEKSKKADTRMRIFNADGSEAEMCGNGARCCAFYVSKRDKKKNLAIETIAGLIKAEVTGDSVKLKMTDPLDLKLGIIFKIGDKECEVDYLNTGVPHAVVSVDDIEKIPVKKLGRLIRHHDFFRPGGTNVDFVKTEDKDHIRVRTYERGVEDETLACGTGSVAAAVIATLNHTYKISDAKLRDRSSVHKVYVKTKSRETLKVYFKLLKKRITDVWLEGRARVVFKGEYHV